MCSCQLTGHKCKLATLMFTGISLYEKPTWAKLLDYCYRGEKNRTLCDLQQPETENVHTLFNKSHHKAVTEHHLNCTVYSQIVADQSTAIHHHSRLFLKRMLPAASCAIRCINVPLEYLQEQCDAIKSARAKTPVESFQHLVESVPQSSRLLKGQGKHPNLLKVISAMSVQVGGRV